MKKVLLVVSLISVLLLAGCNKNEEVNNNVNSNVPEVVKDNQQQEEVINNDENVIDSNLVGRLDESKSLVYSIYSEDAGLNTNEKTEVPNINVNSEDAKAFNEKMNNLVKTIREQRRKNKEVRDASENGNESASKMEEDWYNEVWSDWYEGVEYQYYENGDILSLLIKYQRGYIAGWTQYETFNINTKTGKEYNQLDLVNTYRSEENLINENELMTKVREICIKQLNDDINENENESEEYKEQKLADIDKQVIKDINDVKLYIGENNTLYIFVERFSGAGGSGYYWDDIMFNI